VTEAALREVITAALASAGISVDQVDHIGLGMAGVARPDDWAAVRAIVDRLGLFGHVVLTHDAKAALVGGVGRGHGVVIIAGTGAIAYGINDSGTSRRVDGWGPLLGDSGSAYWIGRHGLRAVARAQDGRGPATMLRARLFDLLGLQHDRELVPLVYDGEFGPPQVAALAPAVCAAAAADDKTARDIVNRAGAHLAHTLTTVIDALGMADEGFEAVLTGGLLLSEPLVRDVVVTALEQFAPRACAIAPRHDAAYGAALLGQTEGCGNVGER
jgi:N-acetylglucosamine kinase-like BadF-type ATPase